MGGRRNWCRNFWFYNYWINWSATESVISALLMVYDYGSTYVIISLWWSLTLCILHCCRSEGKRSYLHLGTDCFVPFNVALIFPPQSPHSSVMSQMMLRIIQSGLYRKLKRDMEWDLRRSGSGKLLAVSACIKWTSCCLHIWYLRPT